MYERLQKAAKMRNISLPNLGKQIGVGERSLYNWKSNDPSLETVVKVCSALDVPLNWLVYGDEQQEDKEKSIEELFPLPQRGKIQIDTSKFVNNLHKILSEQFGEDEIDYLSDDEVEILESFEMLNADGKELVAMYIKTLLGNPKYCEKNNTDTGNVSA